jgi:peptide/nickel transport system substrate-binding protein
MLSLSLGRRPWIGCWFAMAIGCVALAAGCNSGSSSNSATGTAGPAPKTITVAIAANLPGFDTETMAAQEQWIVFNHLYATLTKLSERGTAVPGLAESWKVHADAVDFKLRPGLKFSDGTPLTAQDVVASIKRLMEADAFVYAGSVAPISDVTARGDTDVRFELKRPYPSLPTIFAEPQFGIFPSEKIADPKRFFAKPVSAGEYVIKDFARNGSSITLERNPDYWGPKPAVRTLHFQVVSDPGARLAQLRSGQVDIADNLSPESFGQLTGDIKGRVIPVFGNLNLVINLADSPGSSVEFRKAVSLALDRQAINNVAWSKQSDPAYGFFSPSSQWYEPTIPTRDVEAAKKMIANSPCANGCDLPLLVEGANEPERKAAAVITQNLEEIGVHVKISQSDYGTIFSRGLEGNYTSLLMYIFDYSDAPDVLLSLGLLSDGGLNGMLSGYSSKRMDQLVMEALAASGDQRKQKIHDINELVAEDLPVVPLTSYAYVNGSRVDPAVMEQTQTSLYRVGTK